MLMHLPGKVTDKEVEEMIDTVDRNGDGKISFSEFRYSSPLVCVSNNNIVQGDDGRVPPANI